jgi:outer membrane protein TolC
MKDVRKLYQSVLALSLLTAPLSSVAFADATSSSAAVSTHSAVSVTIDGKVQNYDPAPEIVNGRTIVPLRGVFEALGATVNWDPTTQNVTATKGSTNVQLTIGSYSAEINGMPTMLDQKPELLSGRTMVPLRFVSEALGAVVRWHEESNTVAIYTNVQTNTDTTPANTNDQVKVNDNSTQQLTLAQAMALATTNSHTLENDQASIDRAGLVRDQASTNVKFAPSDGSNAQANQAFTNLQQDTINQQNANKTLQKDQDALAYQVQQAYYAIFQAQKAKVVDDLALQNADEQKQLENVKYNYGTASQFDVSSAEDNFSKAQATAQADAKTIADAYQKFNQLVGLQADARPQLVDQPSYSPLGNVDLDSHVSAMIESSPTIYLKNQQINLAQLGLDLYVFNSGNPDPYKAKEIDVQTAQNIAASAQDQLAQSVRTLYYTMKQTEDQYVQTQASLNSAEQTLKQDEIKYDAGTQIKSVLTADQLAVEQLKLKLYNLVVQHELAKVAFDKPWVAAGTGS